MIIIESDALTIAEDLLEPLVDALRVQDGPAPRVQITIAPGSLTATAQDGTTSRMEADTDAHAVFSIDGDYLTDLMGELGDAVRQAWGATVRVSDTWFAIESPGPYDPETEIPAKYDMTEIGPALTRPQDAPHAA